VIALVDYGAGNLTSVRKALCAIGASVYVPSRPDDLGRAAGIVVPGVGHFAATRALGRGWIDAVGRHVESGRALLGICLGMQWLFAGSDEAPDLEGLGVLAGRCYRLGAVRLKPSDDGDASGAATDRRVEIKVPHVGWNSLSIVRPASVLDGVPDGAHVYFTHSYVAPLTDATAAVTEHGDRFAAVVERDRVAGVQFHPEKSGDVGLQILRNFLALTR
jgi:imidazole glycerol-phosphate synthase subunit HisH